YRLARLRPPDDRGRCPAHVAVVHAERIEDRRQRPERRRSEQRQRERGTPPLPRRRGRQRTVEGGLDGHPVSRERSECLRRRTLDRFSTVTEAARERIDLVRVRPALLHERGDRRDAVGFVARAKTLGERHADTLRAIVSAIVATGRTPRTKLSGAPRTRPTVASIAARSVGTPRSASSRRSIAPEFAMKSPARTTSPIRPASVAVYASKTPSCVEASA